jgi:N-acetylmuramoyl-L-alanine amidase
MTERERLKQRLVATAVEENVDLIERRWPRTAFPRRRRSRFLLIGGVAGLFALAASAAMFYSGTFSERRFYSERLGSGDGAREPEPSVAESRDTALSTHAPRVATSAPATSAPATSAPADVESQQVTEPAATNPSRATADTPQRFRVADASGRGVLPLRVRRVVLDPGHGGANRGTSANGLSEKEITLDIARRLRQLLRERDIEVTLTREADRTLDLDDRVRLANEFRGDLFLSIHVNWLETRERGIETFYLGTTDDPQLNALASQENRDSGYSLTDFRKLLEGIYADVRGDESRRLAEAVHRELYGELRTVSPGLVNRGVKTAPFVVLIGTEMPAILAEVSCLSNELEVEFLRQPAYRQRIAAALSRGVLGYAEALAPSDTLTGDTPTGHIPNGDIAPGTAVSQIEIEAENHDRHATHSPTGEPRSGGRGSSHGVAADV